MFNALLAAVTDCTCMYALAVFLHPPTYNTVLYMSCVLALYELAAE